MMARILGPSNSRLILERIDRSALSLGSARSTNHQESDLDVWIRADSLPPESVLSRLQRDLSLQAESEVDLLVLTPEKLERLKIDDAPFYNYCFLRGGLRNVEPSLTKSEHSAAPGQGLAFRSREEPGGRGLAVRYLHTIAVLQINP
jgi:predicted nucleotidyltransferase